MKQTKLLEWEQVIKMSRLSPESKFLRLILVAGIPVSSGQIAQTWFDDLKIYQDDVLIYENIFSDWAPYTGAALGAGIGVIAGVTYKPIGPIASPLIGAALGVLVGAGIGALASQPTSVATVTIPQIGITPETTYVVTN